MFIPVVAVALPLLFEPNWGQGPAEFSHVGRTANQTALSLAADGVRMERVSYRLVGARRGAAGRLERPMGSRSHYYLGSKRIEGVPHYERVRFTEVYPGTDVVYYSRAGQLEYDFLLQAGADAGRIRLRFAAEPELLADGDLRLADGVKLEKPRAFQEGKEVEARFRVEGREVGFVLGAYDRKKPLRIDPVLVYSVSTGGTAIAADGLGNAYVAGGTISPGGFSQDAFVAKLRPSGELAWLAYLGGSSHEAATSVAVDAVGSVYVAGETLSADFPPRGGNPFQSLGRAEVFAAKFSADGTRLLSTLLGQRMSTPVLGVHAASGEMFVFGSREERFPYSEVITKLNAAGVRAGERAVSPTSGLLLVRSMAVDGDGAPYLAGFSTDPGLEGTAGTVTLTPSALARAFVMKFKGDLTGVEFVALLGGDGFTRANSIAIDGGKNIYVAGETEAPDYPATTTAGPRGRTDGFVTKLCPNATCMVYSTLLGGSGGDAVGSVGITGDGKAWMAGTSSSDDFPLPGAIQGKTQVRPRYQRVTDYGAAMTPLTDPAPGLSHLAVPSLSIHPSDPNRILHFGWQGVSRSADGGATWALTYESTTSVFARAPSNPNVVYQSFFYGVSRSDDDGLTWVGFTPDARIDALSVDAANSDLVYARGSGLFSRSTNGGRTFSTAWFWDQVMTVKAHPTVGNTVFVAGQGFIRRSTNGGVAFTEMPLPEPNAPVREFVIHPANPNLIYASVTVNSSISTRVYRSADGGMTYTRLPVDGLLHIAVAPSDPGVVYGLRRGQLLVSKDMGATWQEARADGVAVSEFVVHPTQAGTVLVGGGEQEWFLARLSAAGALEFSTFISALGFTGARAAADGVGGAVFTDGTRTGRVTDGPVVCTYEVTPGSLFLYGAGVSRLRVVTGAGCAWTAASGAGWLAVNGSGPGTGWVEVRGEPNGGATRSGTMTVAGQTVTVEQAASACAYTLSPEQLPYQPAEGGTVRFTVGTTAGCAWKVDTLPDWATASPTSGTGPGGVDVTLAGAGRGLRAGVVIIGGRTVQVIQHGTCAKLEATLSRGAVAAAGGDLTLTLDTPAGCPWGLTLPPGITVLTTPPNDGPGTVNLRVAPNTGSLHPARRLEIAVPASGGDGTRFEVVQTGVEAATRKPRIVARNASGNFELYTYGVAGTPVTVAGGFAVTWASGQDEAGNVLLAALDTYGALSVARYVALTNAWGAWKRIGGVFQGTPAVAGSGGRTMLLALRDTHNAYWTLGVTEALVVENLRNVGGIFGTDPALAAGESIGEAYVVGKDGWNALWSLRLPDGNWTPLGGVVQGKPSVAMGMDGLAYIAARDSWNGLWVARVNGSTAAGWSFLGGILSQDPVVQTLRNGDLAVGVRDAGAGLWTATFAEGAAGSTGTWKRLGGVLDNYSTAGYGSVAYLAGKDAWNNLWWVRASDTVWSFVDAGGRIRGGVSSSPR